MQTKNTQSQNTNNVQSERRRKMLEAYNQRHSQNQPQKQENKNESVYIESEDELGQSQLSDISNIYNVQEEQKEEDIIKSELLIPEKRDSNPYSFKQLRFWCFVCEKEFSKIKTDQNSEMFCPKCKNITVQITEENENEDHPKNFQIVNVENVQNRQQQNQQQNRRNQQQNNGRNQNQQQQRQQQQRPQQQRQQQQNNIQFFPQQQMRQQNNNNGFHSNSYYTQTTTRRLPNGSIVTQTISSNGRPRRQQNNGNQMNSQQNDQRQRRNNMNMGNMGNINIQNFFGNSDPFFGNINSQMPSFFSNLRSMPFEQFFRQRNRNGPAPAQNNKINQLRTQILTEEQAEQLKDKPCSICMEEVQAKEKVTTLPCKHHYHEDCVKKWLKMHNSCPVCRKAI